VTGLANTPKKDWRGDKNTDSSRALDKLNSNDDFHSFILDHLTTRIKMSERAMQKFYQRWQVNERKVQAYIVLKEDDKVLKEMNETGKPPVAVDIVVPYAYATIVTIVTYLLHTFCGRRPMFQLGSNSGEAENARMSMETLLQWNVDHERLIAQLFQFFMDGQIYGVGIMRTAWKEEKRYRTIWTNEKKTRDLKTVFQGTALDAIDPYMFFPDPRVPMVRLAREGEFQFCRSFLGKHLLKELEFAGKIKGVDRAGELTDREMETYSQSLRGLMSEGDPTPGRNQEEGHKVASFMRVDQGTCVIIPQELGLGPEPFPKKWLFTVLNGKRVVQAEPFDTDHDLHPIAINEPYTLGYSFGQPGMADMVGPLQDVLSWFVNSHMQNVRSAIHNMFAVDPSKIEVNDILNPGPGKVIRLKRSAYGQDVKTAIQQLAVTDVTRSHIGDLSMLMRLADGLTGVTDNLRGLQDSGGRKTATEVRTSGEAAASRLAAQARLISAQGMVDMVQMMICNFQQYSSMEFAGEILGMEELTKFHIKPQQISGDFYLPVHDGTLPLDRVQMMDIWKEIFLTLIQSPPEMGLAQQYNAPAIFEYVAKLGGIQNLSSFKTPQAPPGAPPMMPGNIVPASEPQIAGGQANGKLTSAPPQVASLLGTRPRPS
jgi:hypothetical protein